jgi:hypothetical protein
MRQRSGTSGSTSIGSTPRLWGGGSHNGRRRWNWPRTSMTGPCVGAGERERIRASMLSQRYSGFVIPIPPTESKRLPPRLPGGPQSRRLGNVVLKRSARRRLRCDSLGTNRRGGGCSRRQRPPIRIPGAWPCETGSDAMTWSHFNDWPTTRRP